MQVFFDIAKAKRHKGVGHADATMSMANMASMAAGAADVGSASLATASCAW